MRKPKRTPTEADAYKSVRNLMARFARMDMDPEDAFRAMLLGAALAAFDSGADQDGFKEYAEDAFLVAVALRNKKTTVVLPPREERPAPQMN